MHCELSQCTAAGMLPASGFTICNCSQGQGRNPRQAPHLLYQHNHLSPHETSQPSSRGAGVAGQGSSDEEEEDDDDGGVEHVDCIGAGKPAPLQPLAGVLAKLELRRQQAIARYLLGASLPPKIRG